MATYEDLDGNPVAYEYRPGSTVRTATFGDVVTIQITYEGVFKMVAEPMLLIPIDVLFSLLRDIGPLFAAVVEIVEKSCERGTCSRCASSVTWYADFGTPLTHDGKLACSRCLNADHRIDFVATVREMLLPLRDGGPRVRDV